VRFTGVAVLIASIAIGESRVAAAQVAAAEAGQRRMACNNWRPSHDFRRVTTDSLRVQPDKASPPELVRRVAAEPARRIAPRDRLDYDVVLDVPRLCIDELILEVDSLTARVSLDANVANLVRVSAGAGTAIGRVNLKLSRVRATMLLAVDLSYVKHVVDETMSYLDGHPDVLARVMRASLAGDSVRASAAPAAGSNRRR
jgi:hypothetical protein